MRLKNKVALNLLRLEGVRIERVKKSQGFGPNGSNRWIVREPTTGRAVWAYPSPSVALANLGNADWLVWKIH